jgi:Subtilase family
MRRLALALFLLALAAPGPASAARFAVGVERGESVDQVAQQIEARTGRHVSVIRPFALVVNVPGKGALASTPGVAWVERLGGSRRLSFLPNDPLLSRQWYVKGVRAFDAWSQFPPLAGVRVAVLDSGIDTEHPEFTKQVAAGASFVPSSWQLDTIGHGTFVAGEIAAATNNAQGIAGIGLEAQLLVAKIVRSDGTISPEAEARAIRWAVDHGARIINMSFGGLRDPRRGGEGYSRLEAAAVQYAVSNGVLVVAAVGNGDGAPEEPWGYAGYPAALPHVLGVSAVARDGTVPDFSNRDRVFNDIGAPGEAIFSTLPRALTAITRPGCLLQGYSECGPIEFRRGDGTSFSAPQVAGAAALLFGTNPLLRPDQVSAVLTRNALDASDETGCPQCPVGRDRLTGWGVLDTASAVRALDEPLPEPDRFEANDQPPIASPLWGRRGRRLRATIDFWDDPVDVYGIKLRRGSRLIAGLRGPRGAGTNLSLWLPGTRKVAGRAVNRRLLAAVSKSPGSIERIRFRVPTTGWYYLAVRSAVPGAGAYTLNVRKRPLRGSRPRALP